MNTNKKNNKNKIKLFLVFILSLFFIMYFTNKNFANYINSKILNTNIFFSKNNNVTNLNTESLLAENAILKSEVKKLEEALFLKSENEGKEPTRLLGQISKIYDTFYIQKVQGVNFYEGKYVYGTNNVVFGVVDKVLEDTVKVSFLGRNEKFIAEIVEKNEFIEISPSGLGMYVGRIPKSSEIEVGMSVATKGYPKGVIGTISKVETDDTSINTVWIRAPYNPFNLESFYVSKE